MNASRRRVVTVLGVAQVLAWGSTFYLLAVLALPISVETGWPLSLITGGYSAGLLAAGLVSPIIGLVIQRQGGRGVLVGGALVLALGLAALALAANPFAYVGAWLLTGIGMGAALYDAAFATLGRYYGIKARNAIAAVTLWGGFASTVCWPMSAFLVSQVGWRGACFVYAGLHISMSLALLWFLPAIQLPADNQAHKRAPTVLPRSSRRSLTFVVLAVSISLAALTSSIVSVYLLVLLQDRGLGLAAAVTLGALVGPSQVGARVIEMAFGSRYHPIFTMLAAAFLLAAGLVLLASESAPALAMVLYGAGNGIWSIGRGTLPLALFGPLDYPKSVGSLAMFGFMASALAPTAAAVVLGFTDTLHLAYSLAGAAMLNLLLIVWLLVRSRSSLSLPEE